MKHNIVAPETFIDNLIELRMLTTGPVRQATGVLLAELLDEKDRNPEDRVTTQVRPRSSRRTTDEGKNLVGSST